MSPECLYWIALLALALPSLPYNRMAAVVLLSWAFGHFAHIWGGYEDPSYMFGYILAFGAALALSRPWDGSRRAYANGAIAVLFVPAAVLSAYTAMFSTTDPVTMQEYYTQTTVYWVTWACIMAQTVLVPFGNDWGKVWDHIKRLDDWAIKKISDHFGVAE